MQAILKDFFSSYRPSIVGVLATSIAAVGSNILGLLFVIDYVTVLLSGSARLALLGEFYEKDPSLFLLLMPIAVSILMMLSAAMSFRARAISVNAMLKHEVNCVREMIQKIYSSTVLDPITYSKPDMIRLATRDIRQYGRLIDALLDSCQPLVFFFTTAALLMYLSLEVTSSVLLFVAIFIFFFYRHSRTVTQLGLQMESAAKPDAIARRVAVERALTESGDGIGVESILRLNNPDSEINTFLKTYGRRLRISVKAILISSTFLAVLLSGVLFLLGQKLESGENVIEDFLVYVIVLNFCLIQVRNLSSILTKIRVFQPFSERYRTFVAGFDQITVSGTKSLSVTNARTTTGNVVSRQISTGERFGVLYTDTLNKFAAGEICYSLGIPFSSNFPCSIIPCSNQIERSFVDQFWDSNESTLLFKNTVELNNLVAQDLSNTDIEHESGVFDIHPRTHLIFTLLKIVSDTQKLLLFIDAKALRGIRTIALEELATLLDDKITVLIYATQPDKSIMSTEDFFLTSTDPS